MSKSNVVIAIDAMGGDRAPDIVLEGAELALKARPDLKFILCGDEEVLKQKISTGSALLHAARFRHADRIVSMDAKPSQALRAARGTSMWKAVHAVKEGEANAAVSAGNTGALMAISKIILRTLDGAHRPAIAALWPTQKGRAIVLDVGANIEADAPQLVEFAIMGEAYARALLGVPRPKVGLLNIGSEDLKGRPEIREAAKLIRESQLDLDFTGFVEGCDIPDGMVDVIVADGFTGNIALKTAEGTAKLIAGFVRGAFKRSIWTKLSALVARPALNSIKDKLDPRTVNGGVFLGLNGLVVKSHGGADAFGFAAALDLTQRLTRQPFQEEIAANLARLRIQGCDRGAEATTTAGAIS